MKTIFGGFVKTRTVIAFALAVTTTLAVSSCNLLAPQATTKQYDASDGFSGNVGAIKLRNALLVSDDGKTANLAFSAVNESDTEIELTIQVENARGDKTSKTVSVVPSGISHFGLEPTSRIILRDLNTRPGALFPVYFHYGNESGTELRLPVLDGKTEPYTQLLPTDEEALRTPAPSP